MCFFFGDLGKNDRCYLQRIYTQKVSLFIYYHTTFSASRSYIFILHWNNTSSTASGLPVSLRLGHLRGKRLSIVFLHPQAASLPTGEGFLEGFVADRRRLFGGLHFVFSLVYFEICHYLVIFVYKKSPPRCLEGDSDYMRLIILQWL